MTGWGDVFLFLFIIAIGETGKFLDQDSRYYTCPCYCEIKHEHVRNKNDDRCEKSSTMAMQDSCALYVLRNDEICGMDSSCYSESFEPLSRTEISLTKWPVLIGWIQSMPLVAWI